jgi:tetratricopeptide (TPR) repeat protein
MDAPPDPTRTVPAAADPAHTRSTADSTADAAGSAPPAAGPPSVPGYELLEQIGRGGMGVVYRARDARLDRDVAVKLLADKFPVDSAAARRFRDEARITGQLQHPGIPAVHELGATPDGRPFLAMKLIKGDTLDDLLRRRPDPTADRGRLVAAFEQACQAVAYAHAHGVVHRDLKPTNVMVGAYGEVQVMDWGLAKVLGDRERERPGDDPGATTAGTEVRSLRDGEDQFTQAGSVLGTPAYMPREQAIGAIDQIDRRSDVFGLGGILAAVLTGRPPYVGDSAESTRQMAAVGRVTDCFGRLDGCGADPELVSLCKRCLAVEKGDRPADAGEVARAVAALRQAAEERARRAELDKVRAEGERAAADLKVAEQRRRFRLRLALAGLAGVLVLAGGAFGWYSDRQAAAERERRWRNAEAVGGLLDQAQAALAAGDAAKAGPLLDAADARAVEGGAEDSAGRRESLRADLGLLNELERADRFRWTPDGPKLPDPAQVAAQYKATLTTFGADPDTTGPDVAAGRMAGTVVRDRLVAALDYVLWQGQSRAARAALRLADPDELRDVVRDAWTAGRAAAAVAGPAATAAVLAALAGQAGAPDQPPGFVAVLGGDPAVPVSVGRGLLGAAVRRRPGDPGLLLVLGNTYPLNRREGADERARWAQAAVAVAPDNPVPHTALGIALLDRGDYDGAVAEYQKAIRLDPYFAPSHNNLGLALQRKGDPDGAVAECKEAIRLDPSLAMPHINLGMALEWKGDLDGAMAEHKEAIRLDPKLANAHNGLGWVLQLKGDLDGAVAECKEAIRLDPSFALAHSNLGLTLERKGDPDGAMAAYKEAIRLDPNLALAHNGLGWVLQLKRDLDGAMAEHKEAIRLNPNFALAHNNLGYALQLKGDLDGAVAAYKEAIRLDPKQRYAARNLSDVERMRALLPRLSGVLAGTERPATPAEALGFADLCEQPFQRRYAAAARLYAAAFAADPALAADLAAAHRYSAASNATRAARGDGADAPADAAARAPLRAQALGWLRADLALRRRQAASASASERKSAAAPLGWWLVDSDLAGVRPGLARIGVPAAERAEWDRFWVDVRATIAEARKPPPPPEVAPPPRPSK